MGDLIVSFGCITIVICIVTTLNLYCADYVEKKISFQFNSMVADIEHGVGNHADKKEFTGTSRNVGSS